MKGIIKKIYNLVVNKNFRQFVFLNIRYSRYPRFQKINNIKFLKYRLDVPDAASFLGQIKEIFVDDSYKFISTNKKPVILDCGANIGLSCLYFKSLYPDAKITAFEADKNISRILSTNLNTNNIFDVMIINSAVWIDDNGIEFSTDGADGGSIHGSSNKSIVNSLSLKYFLENKFKKIDLLKIDIEGAEYEVIKDCKNSLKNVKNIFIEYHSWSNSSQKLSEILSILENNNFRYFIDGICGRSQPFVNNGKDRNMDLQLNIFGIKEY